MEVHQRFRRLVYVQVLLGIVAFCMAEENPGLMLIAGAIGALSWYVAEGPGGRPIPQWLVHLGAAAAVGWLIIEIARWRGGSDSEVEITSGMIMAMGHFTMWLQILQLFGKKDNREYALILVLSLMQMIGASVLNPSMIYGVLLAAYSLLALFTLLLFQFKSLSDMVHDATRRAAPQPQRVKPPPPVAGRGMRWQFRVTASVVALTCAAVAGAVFVTIPRRPDARFSAGLLKASPRREVGFSNQINLRGGSIGQGSDRAIMTVAVTEGGQAIGENGVGFLLRGTALDKYDTQAHTWRRSKAAASSDVAFQLEGRRRRLADATAAENTRQLVITARQLPNGIFFTQFPPTAIECAGVDQVFFNPFDQLLTAGGRVPGGAVTYSLESPIRVHDADLFDEYRKIARLKRTTGPPVYPGPGYPSRPAPFTRAAFLGRGWYLHRDRISELAETVLAAKSLSRDPQALQTPDDQRIAEALANWLQDTNNFSYTLENPAGSEADPLTSFLLDHREGHCELFASGMAAMARSIGMRARVVTGFRVSEYNAIGRYFVVRQNNAHAWTEIHLPGRGWQTFDPTPPGELEAEHTPDRGLLGGLRDIYEYLELNWLGGFVAFDDKTQSKMLSEIRESAKKAADDRESWLGSTLHFVKNIPQFWHLDRAGYALVALTLFFIVVALFSLARTIIVRRRRIAALQLEALPRQQRRALTRRLRFYLVMLDMLERHGYHRPRWQTPAAFARDLVEANPGNFNCAVVLTDIFYEIRFGHRELDDPQRQRIRENMQLLEDALVSGGSAPAAASLT